MKKILLTYLIISSSYTFSMRIIPKEFNCKNYGWAELIIGKNNTNGTIQKHLVCIAPNGHYYFPLDLWANHYEYQLILEQYAGQYPTFEQIEYVKKQMKQDGFIVN